MQAAMIGPVRKLLQGVGARTAVCFRTRFPDGSEFQNHDREPDLYLLFRKNRALWNVLFNSHVGLLESYFAGDIDLEGDLKMAFRLGMDSGFDRHNTPLVLLRNRWHEFRFSNRSLAQAKANANFHYSLGTDFYRYWLDSYGMMYTCAYWKEGTKTIEEAQRNKIEHVCKKLRLQPGETVADIGCGWGGFMFHAQKHHGVRCTGYNASKEQVGVLADDIRQRGLGNELEVIEADFREVDRQFDKVAHIGVLEHAGRDQIDVAVKALADAVKPGGLGVLHFIGHIDRFDTEFYVRKHIFPGGWIPSLTECLNAMARHDLEIHDIENLRRHYALTLDAWAERFEAHWDDIHRLDPVVFNEHFHRKWRTYLWSCAEMFRSRNSCTGLYQIVFSKGNAGDDYPMSRRYLYEGG
jgi:cyclopropane-fatty-acyl-phospholipid synthase